MELAQRRTRFALGVALALLPIALWMLVPDTAVFKLVMLFHTDARLIEAYFFFGGAIIELVAAFYLFERAPKRPWDWLSICAVTAGAFSVVAVIVFWGAVAAVTLQGW